MPPPPSAASYRLPPEWDPHTATWLAWPHNRTDWPGKMAVIPWVYAEIVRQLTSSEPVRIVVNDAQAEQKARRVLDAVHVDLANVTFYQWPTNRGWLRDSGPIVALGADNRPVIVDFGFNAWARYPRWQKDDTIAGRAAEALNIPTVIPMHHGRRVVLEGGAIDVNGEGTLLTTSECLLDPRIQVRNRGFTATDYEDVFRYYLGAEQTLWLDSGIAGDDTHGHIDDVCRFVNAHTVVLAQETNCDDVNYAGLAKNFESLSAARLPNGTKLEVVPLPMPAPLFYRKQRLPASYANFYIGNEIVLVPTFNDSQDRTALGILTELFPDRRVVGIHATDLVLGGGSLHCLTQQAI